MKAVITETQSLAQHIAQALNIETKPDKDGFLYGRGHSFAWMPEELINLAQPEDDGIIRFLKKDLPFIPMPLSCIVRQRKTARGMSADPSAVRQLENFRRIFERAEQIIIATEPDERGELAFRRLYAWLGSNKPCRRLWLHSILPVAIRECFRNLKDSALFDNMYAAANCRSQADFLLGVNASAAFSLTSGIAGCRLGRLHTPVLAMVCKPLIEYRKFMPAPFNRLSLTLEKDGLFRQFAIPQSDMDNETAERIYENLKTCQTATITKADAQRRIQPAPLLYNLTALQMDASMRYGFSAQKTMEIARQLYERNLVSYPCTDSRYIPASLFASIPKLLRQTACYSEFTDCLDIFEWHNLNRRSVEEGEPTSLHHALIPTGIYPGFLTGDHKTVYRMIVARTLEAFAPDCLKEATHIEAVAADTVSVSNISQIISKGWRAVLNRKEDNESDEVDRPFNIPTALDNPPFDMLTDSMPTHSEIFATGKEVPISGCSLAKGKTSFPTLHTEATLLEAMERNSLGTPATRASIIETLIEWQCIERKGQFLRPAERGLVIYNSTKDMRISQLDTTVGWERMLNDIANGKQNPESFLKAIEVFTRQATKEILTLSLPKL
jgi:DNA topoisomerase-3